MNKMVININDEISVSTKVQCMYVKSISFDAIKKRGIIQMHMQDSSAAFGYMVYPITDGWKIKVSI